MEEFSEIFTFLLAKKPTNAVLLPLRSTANLFVSLFLVPRLAIDGLAKERWIKAHRDVYKAFEEENERYIIAAGEVAN